MEGRVADGYWTIEDNKFVFKTTLYDVPEDRYIPELEFDESLGEFYKWKFDKVVKNDKRWARDFYKRNGYEKVKLKGDAVTVWSK